MKEEINKIQENVEAQNFVAQIVLTETEYKKIMFYNIRLQERIDKAIEILKDTSVDMPSTLLIETIGYARHILGGKE